MADAKLQAENSMASSPVSKLTEQEYLAIERAAEFRSEFVNGEMFAMSGGTMNHADLQRNLLLELHLAVKMRGCKAVGPDLRVKISARTYVYPDVSVVCGKPAADENQDNLLNPVVIVEVLSPSTEKYDRGLKFQLYRTIQSLKDYILVDQHQILVEHYTRQPGGTWALKDYQKMEETLTIGSISASIPLARIYEGIALPGNYDGITPPGNDVG